MTDLVRPFNKQTILSSHNPIISEWNDSLTGDYLWSKANLSEAVPNVMTPSTCFDIFAAVDNAARIDQRVG